VGTKSRPADFVTETDREVEEYVRKRIAEEFPDDAVVGEEFGASGPSDAPRRWFVDPVDGTTNYAHGVPWASFSLGLVDAAGRSSGVVPIPIGKRYSARPAMSGARLGGVPIRCASEPTWPAVCWSPNWPAPVWDGLLPMIEALAAPNARPGFSARRHCRLPPGSRSGRRGRTRGYNTWDVVAGVRSPARPPTVLGRDGWNCGRTERRRQRIDGRGTGDSDAVLNSWRNNTQEGS